MDVLLVPSRQCEAYIRTIATCLLAIHSTSGQPGRGEELTQLRIRNTQDEDRSLAPQMCDMVLDGNSIPGWTQRPQNGLDGWRIRQVKDISLSPKKRHQERSLTAFDKNKISSSARPGFFLHFASFCKWKQFIQSLLLSSCYARTKSF